MFVDTHCHLNIMTGKQPDEPLDSDLLAATDEVVAQALDAGVKTIINVGTSLVESANSLALAARHESVFATVGIHPCDIARGWQADFNELADMVKHAEVSKIVAIGETGLDFYHTPFDQQLQEQAFRAHIELAAQHNLPLVVHVRDAGEQALRILEEYRREVTGVIHCFSLDLKSAQTVVEWGWFIGIDGPITYKKNDDLRTIVASVPLEHILLETDAPFLTPQEYRGSSNHPRYLPLIAAKIAEVRSTSLESVATVTSANARRLFRLDEY